MCQNTDNLMKDRKKIAKPALLLLILAIMLFGQSVEIFSQARSGYPVIAPRTRMQLQEENERNSKVVFPDEYSDLDDKTAQINRFKSDEFKNDMEQARQRYYQALILIQKRDTARAARYFDAALEKLNDMAATPGIEENKDFADLAQSIIDDYENYVKSVEFLDENSPIFIIREILFKEIDVIEPLDLVAQDSKISVNVNKSANFPKLPKGPDSLVVPLDSHVTVDKSIQFLTRGQGKRIFSRWLERSSR